MTFITSFQPHNQDISGFLSRSYYPYNFLDVETTNRNFDQILYNCAR